MVHISAPGENAATLRVTNETTDASIQMRVFKGEATIESSGTGDTLFRIQPEADQNINFFGLAATGENPEFKVFGRDSADTVTPRLSLRWGDGTNNDAIFQTNNGGFRFHDSSDVLVLDVNSGGTLDVKTQATAPATCAIGAFYVDTSGAYCACTSTNTWSNMSGVGTCV